MQPKLLRKLKNKLEDLHLWVKYTFVDRHDIIKISTLPRMWHDSDTKILHSNFQILTDFVEVEKGFLQGCMEKSIPRGKLLSYFSFMFKRNYASRELGLKYLDWELTIPEDGPNGCPGQAQAAKEIKELYLWWKDIYPNRPWPMDVSGLSDFLKKNRTKLHKFRKCEGSDCFEMYSLLTEEEEKEYKHLCEEWHKIEEAYVQEEEDMLIRLIKIRRMLWT